MTDQDHGMSADQTPQPQQQQQPQPPEIVEPTPVSIADEAQQVVVDRRPKSIWEHLRPFLACNPFYLLSAALLLYSFYLVSIDRNFLTTDVAQLGFNLGSLQLYEMVVVLTAIWLARRAIWYDSTLLVGLENLLVLVPFMLVSEAALIDVRLVWNLCVMAGLVAAYRMSLLRRGIRELHFPPRLFGIGMLMVAVNAGMPALYRVLHESKFGKEPDWGAAYHTNQYVWWLLFPALCALFYGVPFSRSRQGEIWPQRRWLPMGLFSLWLVGTGVHLYSLTYIYDFALRPELLAPTVWALLWVLWLRVSEWVPNLKQTWRNALWILPGLATLIAVPQPGKAVFVFLTIFNIAIYTLLYRRSRISLALHLALISSVALLGGLPESWGSRVSAGFSAEKLLCAAGAIYVLICISMVRSAKLGMAGAVIAAIMVGIRAGAHPLAIHWAIQAGLVFLLLHSLRWNDPAEPGANVLRWIAAIGWVAHSLVWIHGHEAGWQASVIAACVLGIFFAVQRFREKRAPLVIMGAALCVLFAPPGHLFVVQLRTAPAGLLAVIGSFVLFGLGTLGALTRNRWGAR